MDLSGNGDPSSICTVMRSDGTSLYATRFVSYVKVIPIRMCVWLHGLCSRIKAKTIFLSSKLLPSPSSKSFILITQNIFIGFLFIASYNSWKGLILSEVIENCSQLVKHHRIFTAEYIVLLISSTEILLPHFIFLSFSSLPCKMRLQPILLRGSSYVAPKISYQKSPYKNKIFQRGKRKG